MSEEDLKEIKKIFKFMLKEDLVELNLEDKDYKLKLRRKENRFSSSTPIQFLPLENTGVKDKPKKDVEKISPGCQKIDAPLGGVFYRSPAPGAAPFISEDESIKKGQTLCIIEAMKMMNEIQSEVSGKIVKIIAQNGQRVESGQTLFIVMPE